jgi:uncharacterized integral membrane protein
MVASVFQMQSEALHACAFHHIPVNVVKIVSRKGNRTSASYFILFQQIHVLIILVVIMANVFKVMVDFIVNVILDIMEIDANVS